MGCRIVSMAKRFMAGIAGLCLFFVLVRLITSDSSKDKAANSAPEQQQRLPPDEREFISTISEFRTRYEQAANEFQKSAVRTDRAAALARIVASLSITEWIGTISSMQTTSDGLGVLSVELPTDKRISVGTWNNGFSDIGSNTLIRHGSMLYNEIAHLAIGNKVEFSGTFGAGNLDYLKESSMTEAGAMTDPAFIFTFTHVGTGVVPPKTPSVWIRSDEPKAESEPKAEPIQPAPSESIAPVAPSPAVPSEPAPAPESAPAPALPVDVAKPTSGVLCSGIIGVPQKGELTFNNLPGDRLKFTFDHDAWSASIHRQPDGTQTLVMRSIKPGIQTKCDMRWEIAQ